MKNTETTTVAIETLSSFSEDFQLPSTLESGVYILRVSVTSLDGTKSSEATTSIQVKKVSQESRMTMEYFMGISFVGVIVALVFEHRRVTKMRIEKDDLQKYVNSERKR